MMRYITGCFIAAVIATIVTSCESRATIKAQAQQIAGYKYALEIIGQDMQINYVLHQATIADLAECRATK